MNSQLRFFMTAVDEDDFLNEFVDVTFDKSSNYQWFAPGPGGVQFLRCSREDDEIIIGRISIRTFGTGQQDQEAEDLYRKMVRFIKRHYSNRVQARNRQVGATAAKRDIWVGPDTQALGVEGVTLVQAIGGQISYEVDGA